MEQMGEDVKQTGSGVCALLKGGGYCSGANVMMLGSKGILTPMIPNCYAFRAHAILKNIHNPLIFLRKMAIESLNLRPIEKSKIDCAKKLFAKLSDGLVTYDHVDNYQELLNKVLQ